MFQRLLTAAIASGLLVSTPGTANSATWNWNSRSSPLNVYSNGASGTRLGQGYGSVTLTGRTTGDRLWAVSYTGRGYLRDLRPGNNSIYWENLVQILGEDWTNQPFIKMQSSRWNGSGWHLFTRNAQIVVARESHRADIQRRVCEDRRFQRDPCHAGWRPTPLHF